MQKQILNDLSGYISKIGVLWRIPRYTLDGGLEEKVVEVSALTSILAVEIHGSFPTDQPCQLEGTSIRLLTLGMPTPRVIRSLNDPGTTEVPRSDTMDLRRSFRAELAAVEPTVI